MPEIITKDDGTEVEVFTAEELEAQKATAVEQFKSTIEDKTEEYEKMQEELAKLKDKDFNFSEVSRQKKEAELKATEALKSVDEKLEKTKKEILEGVQQEHFGSVIAQLSGGDDELKKKIEFHYGRLTDSASTKEEVTKKLTDAYVLATRKEDGGVLNTAVISSGGAARVTPPSMGQSISSEEESVLQRMAQAGGFTLEKGKDY